jgi:hypothetical protein
MNPVPPTRRRVIVLLSRRALCPITRGGKRRVCIENDGASRIVAENEDERASLLDDRADADPFSAIEDPVAWQRTLRND